VFPSASTVADHSSKPSTLRALLILGRVSNLPTVWSNCLAGWLLGGGGDVATLLRLIAGATLVYTGGMFLNDAFDAEFDRLHRPERPIPSGEVGEATVWACGLGWLLAGTVVLAFAGWQGALHAALLAMMVLVYDAAHKQVGFAPLLMAACRFELYLVAAASGAVGLAESHAGLVTWSGLVMAVYIVGLSALARREATGGTFGRWPLVLLAAPVGLALVVNDFETRQSAVVLGFIAAAWVLLALRPALRQSPPDIGASVSRLLAGIPLMDLLAVGVVSPGIAGQGWTAPMLVGAFGGCFLAARFAQRYVPAT